MSFPIVMTPSGRQPTSPDILRSELLIVAESLAPGLTANLPGALIEDIASTDVGALSVMDSAVTELINSVTPYGANEFILNQQGAMFGVQKGVGANGSVYVTFTGTVGFVVSPGFTVSDGSHQYVVQDGGIVGSGGVSSALYAVATVPGTFPIPAATVTTLVTSVPGSVTLSVTNLTAGTPAVAAQTSEEYRAQVLQAQSAPAQGFTTYLKTQLQKITGVQARLVSVQQSGTNWQVVCGGGDPYRVGYAIFTSTLNPGNFVGSTLSVTGITNANPGVVTTDKAHGLTTGTVSTITGVVGMTGINSVPLTITVLTPYTFSIGINTTSSGAWVSGGVVVPNVRNVRVSINDYPDSYTIPFVTPLAQTVGVTLTWNTISPSFLSPAAVAALGNPAIVSYINGIVTGQPINLFEMQNAFQTAVAGVLDPSLITRMVFAVTVNGVPVSPTAGTGIIPGDPESYFTTNTASVVISQG